MRVVLVIAFMVLLTVGLTVLYRSIPMNRSAVGSGKQVVPANERVTAPSDQPDRNDHLVVVWTSGDPEVALDMVLMYTYNAKKQGWWQDVTLVVWGPSQKLAVENQQVREELARMQGAGIDIIACKACSDRYGVTDGLQACGVDVDYIGTTLTEFIQTAHVITF